MRLAIELADAGIIALPQEGEAAAPSPGLAIIERERIIVGRDAAARARLTPRRLHDRFWIELSTEALGRPFGRRLRSADLAWTQLSEIWRAMGRGVTSVILALPSGFSEEQLRLILGIARSAGLPVDGLVNAPVAASTGRVDDPPVLHLDVELHRAVLTLLRSGPKQDAVLISDRVGLTALDQAWLRWIAGRFLRDTRYDPFHSAESEQALADRLGPVLDDLRHRVSTTLTLAADGRTFSIDLDRDEVQTATETQLGEIDTLVGSALVHRPNAILLTARAAKIPGLADRLAHLADIEVSALPLAAAAAGAHQHADRIIAPGDALPLTHDLGESTTEPIRTTAEPTAAATRGPTHLLIRGVAHPLGSEPLWLGSAPDAGEHGITLVDGDGRIHHRHCVIRQTDGPAVVEDLSGEGLLVNDRPVTGRAELHVGDRLRLGASGVEIVPVVVEA